MDWERVRTLILQLESAILHKLLQMRSRGEGKSWASAVRVEASDVIYQIDDQTEAIILDWMEAHWPATFPCLLVMEGLENRGRVTFPEGVTDSQLKLTLIIDPIDGTRMIMFDKRSAWILAAVAPYKGPGTTLEDIEVAAMTEIPPSKQWQADQVSAIKGKGLPGIRAEGIDVRGGMERFPIPLLPSREHVLEHGFASFAQMLPFGKEEISKIEMDFWRDLYGEGTLPDLAVFEDQYISAGGQIYEVISGRDRMVCDLRAIVFPRIGEGLGMACHPYDICVFLIARELGCVFETPTGGPMDFPLDTTTSVSWVIYANSDLADLVRPRLKRLVSSD